ncbi:hypothetical protein BDQ17DRAFT_1404963 [Cyathus striatus]|nr:hypothetical protein BDQ17DRAFT_1404963 [Cyathus striatus]
MVKLLVRTGLTCKVRSGIRSLFSPRWYLKQLLAKARARQIDSAVFSKKARFRDERGGSKAVLLQRLDVVINIPHVHKRAQHKVGWCGSGRVIPIKLKQSPIKLVLEHKSMIKESFERFREVKELLMVKIPREAVHSAWTGREVLRKLGVDRTQSKDKLDIVGEGRGSLLSEASQSKNLSADKPPNPSSLQPRIRS